MVFNNIEIARLIKRKAGRYIRYFLDSLEKEMGDDIVTCPDCGEKFKTGFYPIARKHLLDCVNDFTRGIWFILGIEIEGSPVLE